MAGGAFCCWEWAVLPPGKETRGRGLFPGCSYLMRKEGRGCRAERQMSREGGSHWGISDSGVCSPGICPRWAAGCLCGDAFGKAPPGPWAGRKGDAKEKGCRRCSAHLGQPIFAVLDLPGGAGDYFTRTTSWPWVTLPVATGSTLVKSSVLVMITGVVSL